MHGTKRKISIQARTEVLAPRLDGNAHGYIAPMVGGRTEVLVPRLDGNAHGYIAPMVGGPTNSTQLESNWDLSHKTRNGTVKKRYHCSLCNIECGNMKDFNSHCSGKKHKKRSEGECTAGLQPGTAGQRENALRWLNICV